MFIMQRAGMPARQETSYVFASSMSQLALFTGNEPVPSADPAKPTALFVVILCSLPVVAACLALGLQIAGPIESATVGVLWGGIFLSGFAMGGIYRGRVMPTIAASVYCWIATYAFVTVSDFPASESLLLTLVNTLAGWLAGVSFTNRWSTLRQRSQSDPTAAIERPSPTGQFGILDIVFLTSCVAMVCSGLPGVTSPISLLACGVAAVLGGLVSSHVASRWAWHDHWKLSSVTFFIAMAGLGLMALVLRSPMPTITTLKWFLAGPASTIAAQGTTVLFFCAAYRWDLSYRRRMLHASS